MLSALDTPLRPLGRIVRLQVQPERIKRLQGTEKRYDPAGLLAVTELTLTPRGALARQADGAALLDVHHADHPDTGQSSTGVNALSVGFTSHYALMRERFGQLLSDGLAGENILVEVDQPVMMEQLAGGLAIESAAAGLVIALAIHKPAAPCRPFTTYLLQDQVEPEAMKSALQFLDGGMRGFYGALLHAGPVTVAVGDRVLLPGGL